MTCKFTNIWFLCITFLGLWALLPYFSILFLLFSFDIFANFAVFTYPAEFYIKWTRKVKWCCVNVPRGNWHIGKLLLCPTGLGFLHMLCPHNFRAFLIYLPSVNQSRNLTFLNVSSGPEWAVDWGCFRMIYSVILESFGRIVFSNSVELELHFLIRIFIIANILFISSLNLIASSIVSVTALRPSTYK